MPPESAEPQEVQETPEARLQRSLRRLVVATVALYLFLAGFAAWTWIGAHKNTDALCTLRADLQTRVAGSRQFLKEHPKGVPGIPAKLIQEGIVNQQRTIHALRKLSCPSP